MEFFDIKFSKSLLLHAIHSTFLWRILKFLEKNPRNKKTWVFSWISFCRTENEGRKPEKNSSLRSLELCPETSTKMPFKNSISVYVWCRFYIFWSHKRTVQFTVLYGGHLSISCWSSCRNITPWMLVHKWWCVRRDSWWSMFRRWCLMTSLPHQGGGGEGRGSDPMRCQPVTNSSSLSSGGATDYIRSSPSWGEPPLMWIGFPWDAILVLLFQSELQVHKSKRYCIVLSFERYSVTIFSTSGFFHELGPFQFFLKICGDIRLLRVHHRCHWHRWQIKKIFNRKICKVNIWMNFFSSSSL